MGLSLETLVTVCGEEHVWLARYGATHVRPDSPYTGTLTVVRREHDLAYIFGAAGPVISHAERKTLIRLLRAQGLRRTRWIRKRADGDVHGVALATHDATVSARRRRSP